jgi:hypothetical protein
MGQRLIREAAIVRRPVEFTNASASLADNALAPIV